MLCLTPCAIDRRTNLSLHSAGSIAQIPVTGSSFSEDMLCREEWDQQLSLLSFYSLVPKLVSISAVVIQLISLGYGMLVHGKQAWGCPHL